jgi:ATP-dependent exoDNAse (exonuclease V) beta subunit
MALYEGVKARLILKGAEVLHLTTSFRAPPSIQSFVNAAFTPAMIASPDRRQPGYVPLEKSRPEIKTQPTLVALPVPRPYSRYGKVTKGQIEESFPSAVGGFIKWLTTESGRSVEDNGDLTPIRPRIAILFRRLRNFGADVTRDYVHGLEGHRIPHVLVGGRSFHDCEEVIALRNALAAIEWPDDELSMFATLRGPFFALNDEILLAFRQEVEDLKPRRLNPMRPIDRTKIPPATAEIADALELLRDLHIGRNRRPIAQTIMMFVEAARARRTCALARR